MAQIITLDQPKEVVIVQEQKTSVSNVEFLKTEDDRTECLAFVNIAGSTKMLVLWSSETTPTYEEAGQYTDEDIEARVKQVVSEL